MLLIADLDEEGIKALAEASTESSFDSARLFPVLSRGMNPFSVGAAPAWLVTQSYTNQNFSMAVLGVARCGVEVASILVAKAAWRHAHKHDTSPDECSVIDTIQAFPLTNDQMKACVQLWFAHRSSVSADVALFIGTHNINPLHMWVSDDDSWSTFLCDCGEPWMGESEEAFIDEYGKAALEEWETNSKTYVLSSDELALLRSIPTSNGFQFW
jgi:hypothetical protein